MTRTRVVMAVVRYLGVLAILGLGSATLLLFADKVVPPELWLVGSNAATALATLLASTRSTPEPDPSP